MSHYGGLKYMVVLITVLLTTTVLFSQQIPKKKKDKNYFIFAFDTLNISDLENFPFIDCWVNTACPRIADERKNMINISDIL